MTCKNLSPQMKLECELVAGHHGPHLKGTYLWKEGSHKEVRNLCMLHTPVYLGKAGSLSFQKKGRKRSNCEICGYPTSGRFCRFHASQRNGLLMARREAWRIRVHKEHKEVIVHGGKFAHRWNAARQPSCGAVT